MTQLSLQARPVRRGRLRARLRRPSTASPSTRARRSTSAPAGYTLRDIQYLQLEKSKDGSSGAWKLGGVRLFVNGRLAYGNARIEHWLRGNARRGARRTSAPPETAETSPGLAVALRRRQLPLRRRRPRRPPPRLPAPQRRHHLPAGDVRRAERPSAARRTPAARSSFDGDRAEIHYRIETFVGHSWPAACRRRLRPRRLRRRHPASSAAAATAAFPDLVITDLGITTFTVSEPGHSGGRAVQRARDRVPTGGDRRARRRRSRRRARTRRGARGGLREARADYLNQVVESNEQNNTRSIDPIC